MWNNRKHKEKRNLKKQILKTSSQLKRCLTNIIYITLLHQINKAINSEIKAVSACHLRKLEKLRLCQNNVSPRKNKTYILNIQFAICHHGLDHQIPLKTDPNLTYTEFGSYFQGIKHKITNLPKIQILHLKTKLRNTYEQYSNINVPYKEREIINKLKKTQNIMFLRQEKGRGIVIIDRKRYTYKCLNILNTKQFQKLDRDPTKPREAKIQRAIRKIKSRRSNQEYMRIYPTGSAPTKIYGMAKKHKIPVNGTINDLPLRPIIFNLSEVRTILSSGPYITLWCCESSVFFP